MGLISQQKNFHRPNCVFQLHLLCVFIGLLSSVAAQDSSTSHDGQFTEAKAKLLKMIQKGMLPQFYYFQLFTCILIPMFN